MKFSFEKIQKKTPENATEALEVQEELTELEKQEQFDAECVEEAEKLGKGIEELQAEIDSMGGPEKFKEIFEAPRYADGNGTRASKELEKFEDDKKYAKDTSKRLAVGAAIFGGLVVLAEQSILEGETVSDKFQEIKNLWEYQRANAIGAGVTMVIFTSGSILFAVQAIKERIKARRLEKQKKIEALKFKMTGTEVK